MTVRWSGLIDRIEEVSIALALAAMTLLTFIQVVLRYLFSSGLVWSLEVTTYLFGWLVLIGMAYGIRTRSHIAVDLVTRAVPPTAARVVAAVAFGICLAYSLAMVYGSVDYVVGLITLGHNAQDIPVPRWIIALMLPIGFGLLAFRLIQAGWRYFLPAESGVSSVGGEAGGLGADRTSE